MATYTRTEKVNTTVEYFVPNGTLVELDKAIRAAVRETYADIMFRAADDGVIVYFEDVNSNAS